MDLPIPLHEVARRGHDEGMEAARVEWKYGLEGNETKETRVSVFKNAVNEMYAALL